MDKSTISGITIRPFLELNTVKTSAPCRIDCGNTWDVKPMALLGQDLPPITVNIALNLRTTVRLLPFKDGWVRVSSRGFAFKEFPLSRVSLTGPLRLVLAVLFYFKVSGVHVVIESAIPGKGGLGGSGVVAVCVIAGISKVLSALGKIQELSRPQIVRLAHDIEDGLRISYTGLQDQAAAALGGVNKWSWDYNSLSSPFSREELVTELEGAEFEKHLLLACAGRRGGSKDLTSQWVEGFLNGTTREQWYEIHDATSRFAKAVRERDWSQAVQQLRRETVIRVKMTPEVLTPVSTQLVEQAEQCDCAARFAGDGKGGYVWAIGPEEAIHRLHRVWYQALKPVQDGKLLDCGVDFAGLVQDWTSAEGSGM